MVTLAVVLIAVGCSVGLVFLLRNARLGGRRLASDYLVLAITLIGTFVGVTLALVLSEGREQARIHRRCVGILEAGERTTEEAVYYWRSCANFAHDAYAKGFDDFRGTSEPPPFRPTPESLFAAENVMLVLLQDGEIFACLSGPFREVLPSRLVWQEWDFSEDPEISGFAARLGEAEHAWLHWEVLRRCFSLELAYQRAELDLQAIESELETLWTWEWREISRIAVAIGGIPLPDSLLGLPEDPEQGVELTKEPN